MWMGLVLAGGDQTKWQWPNGSLTTWYSWASGQPMSDTGCAYVNRSSFSWASAYCLTTRPFLCQYQLLNRECAPDYVFIPREK